LLIISKKPLREELKMIKVGVLFPGQGAQFVGMGKDFYDKYPLVKDNFDKASECLGIDLADLCFNGPEEELKKTQYTQPALLTVEYSIFQQFKRYFDGFGAGAGHSLGEYTALLAADAIDFSDAVNLVHQRGKFMSEITNGSLVACMGLSEADVWKECKELSEYGTISPALFNSPGQVVVAGEVPVLEKFVEKCSNMSGVKATMLKVSGPFHCSLLDSAAKKLENYLKDIKFSTPRFSIASNVTGEYESNPNNIKENLVKQVNSPVYWTKCVETLFNDGYNTLVEIGPGKVLRGLARKINRNIKVLNVSTVEDITKVSQQLEDLYNSTMMEKE
jgi:[acyl-carrier-protein] S-malonyltransferase